MVLVWGAKSLLSLVQCENKIVSDLNGVEAFHVYRTLQLLLRLRGSTYFENCRLKAILELPDKVGTLEAVACLYPADHDLIRKIVQSLKINL